MGNDGADRPANDVEGADEAASGRLSWRGEAALGLFAVHLVLLFLPPLPPYWKGSVWDYALGYGAVALAAVELSGRSPAVIASWRRLAPTRRLAWGYGSAVVMAALGWMTLSVAPDFFGRFSREEGLWEPITLFLHLGSGVVLLHAARRAADVSVNGSRASARWLAGVGYLLWAAEELDYLGVFGMIVGRVEGEYVGAPHDLLRLVVDGVTPTPITAVVFLPLVGAGVFLWRRGHLRLAAFRTLARSRPVRWLLPAAVLVALALAEEAGLLGLRLATPTPEELIETVGAVLLACFALEVAADAESGSAEA